MINFHHLGTIKLQANAINTRNSPATSTSAPENSDIDDSSAPDPQ